MRLCPIDAVSSEVRSLVNLAISGEEVVITDHDRPVARIVATDERSPRKREPNGPALAALFEKLSELGGIDIEDPVAWQREIRKDRPLPGRE